MERKVVLAIILLALVVLGLACGGNARSGTSGGSLSPSTGSTPSATPSVSSEIGPDAVWDPSTERETVSKIQDCRVPGRVSCAIERMREFGAPRQAIAFFRQTGWFLVGFKELGVVDLGMLLNPWKANSNEDFALLNGIPNVVVVQEEGQKWGQQYITSDPNYQTLLVSFPRLAFWAPDEFFESTVPSSSGFTQFVFQFFLVDGCHACATGYLARLALQVDPDGACCGPVFLNICWAGTVNRTPVAHEGPDCPPLPQRPSAKLSPFEPSLLDLSKAP